MSNQLETNLGALTTTFQPPPACQTSLAGTFVLAALPGNYIGGPAETSDCMPKNYQFDRRAYYSPGVCPMGYTSACASFRSKDDKTETVVTCCPTNFECNANTRAYLETNMGCSSAYKNGLDVPSLTILASNGTTVTSSKIQGQGALNAYSVQIRFQASDTSLGKTGAPTATSGGSQSSGTSGGGSNSGGGVGAGPSGTVDSGSVQGSGLSAGAAAGIGVGAAVGAIAIIGAIVCAFIMGRRNARKKAEQAYLANGGGSIAPSGYNPMMAHSMMSPHQSVTPQTTGPRYEMGGSPGDWGSTPTGGVGYDQSNQTQYQYDPHNASPPPPGQQPYQQPYRDHQ